MTPFRFGPAARQLYGVIHPATPSAANGTAVLLFNPLGQEAVRVHRLQRILCERLADRGFTAMRFDYFGTGESAGDDEEGDLLGWLDDARRAHAELLRRSRAARSVWVGARLGGTIAAMAVDGIERPADRLVLWDPVCNGTAYLDELARGHAEALAEADGRSLRGAIAPLADEAIGFGLTQALLGQLAGIDAVGVASEGIREVAILSSRSMPPDATLARAFEAVGATVHTPRLDHDFDWLTEEAMSTALVPAPVLEALATQVGGERHD